MTDRESDLMAFAQKVVVANLELFGQRISPHVLAGAIEDGPRQALVDHLLLVGEGAPGRDQGRFQGPRRGDP